jgi:hypothetical protein
MNTEMIEKIEVLKKEAITADDLHDVGWNGAINEVLKILKAGQHETIVIGSCEHKNKKWISEIAETYCPSCREIL